MPETWRIRVVQDFLIKDAEPAEVWAKLSDLKDRQEPGLTLVAGKACAGPESRPNAPDA